MNRRRLRCSVLVANDMSNSIQTETVSAPLQLQLHQFPFLSSLTSLILSIKFPPPSCPRNSPHKTMLKCGDQTRPDQRVVRAAVSSIPSVCVSLSVFLTIRSIRFSPSHYIASLLSAFLLFSMSLAGACAVAGGSTLCAHQVGSTPGSRQPPIWRSRVAQGVHRTSSSSTGSTARIETAATVTVTTEPA